MKNRLSSLHCFLVLLVNLIMLAVIMPINIYAQLAKIQRKTAVLTVQPEVVVDGGSFAVTVQPFAKTFRMQLKVYDEEGNIVLQRPVETTEMVNSQVFNFENFEPGNLTVVLETENEGVWTPAAEKTVALLPHFNQDLRKEVSRLETLESKSEDKPLVLRSIWGALAYAEDLGERAKTAESYSSRDLTQRLTVLRKYADTLDKGEDIFAHSSGYQLRGYRSPDNDEMQLYSMYVPKNYDAGRAWPLVVMLHGAWSNHHLALRRVLGLPNQRGESDDDAKRSMPELPEVPYLVVAPNGFETMGYEGVAEADVWRVMDEVSLLFKVDPNRVYLTGLSMGGNGTIKLGFKRPDLFAAVAPVCGFSNNSIFERANANRPEFQKRLAATASAFELAENMLHVPIKIMHGDKDPVVPPQGSVDLNNQLKKLGYKTELEMYPNVDHAAWVPAYENARIFDWFSQFKRDPNPPKVVYTTWDSNGGSAYWVSILELNEIRKLAKITAEIQAAQVTVTTQNLQTLSLRIPQALIAEGVSANITIDGEKVFSDVLPYREQVFTRQDGKWIALAQKPSPRLLPGKSGFNRIANLPQVCAYSTGGSKAEMQTAQTLASLASLQGSLRDIQWKVMPENRLTPEIQAKKNILLFATFTGSTFLQRHKDEFPFKSSDQGLEFAGRKIQPDQGLIMIYPNPESPDHYLVLAAATSVEGLKSLQKYSTNKPFLSSESWGDFAVYDSNGKPLWGGLFDKNWKIETVGDF